jgi:hypothetical protein
VFPIPGDDPFMPTWPVHVQDWQHECCGEPFGIGDRVRWTLVLTDESHEGWCWPDEMMVELRVVGRRPAESEDEGAVEVISTSDSPRSSWARWRPTT